MAEFGVFSLVPDFLGLTPGVSWTLQWVGWLSQRYSDEFSSEASTQDSLGHLQPSEAHYLWSPSSNRMTPSVPDYS